jgi:hypothetical protein
MRKQKTIMHQVDAVVSEKDLIVSYIKGHLDNGFFLVLTPHQYELCPKELREHPNIKVSSLLPLR